MSFRRGSCRAAARFLMPASAAILLAGCASGMQIVQAPFISPIIVPAPLSFKMNVAVKNAGTQSESGWVLFMHAEYGMPIPFDKGNNQMFRLPLLAADQSFGLSDVLIGNSDAPCVKDQCQGHLWLVLCPYAADGWNLCRAHVYDDSRTCLHVQWQPSGNLADLRIGRCP